MLHKKRFKEVIDCIPFIPKVGAMYKKAEKDFESCVELKLNFDAIRS
jgi:hypothetical protein